MLLEKIPASPKYSKCAAAARNVRPNWKGQPTGESLTGKVFR
jgi:hypothetical protein